LNEPLDSDLNFAQSNMKKQVDVVVKTCLAFGGVNSALVFKRFNAKEEPKL
jgi:3-oxoacyl-(acyl-carrier-protein) synthase